MAAKLKKGIFITFEGTEGSGKSTQSKMLTAFLKKKGFKVAHIWDPGSTSLGESVRDILLNSKDNFSYTSETLLYLAARAQLAEEKILPALKDGSIVICDRFIDATISYQGYGLGIDVKEIERMNKFVISPIREPDLTIFLEVDICKGLERAHSVKGFSDRIERRSIDFHKRVKSGYMALSKKYPKRIKRISIEKNDIKDTQEIVRSAVLDVIKGRKGTRKRA
ncbi:dTMP kinase [Candidatus Omnitrophota bacterium]